VNWEFLSTFEITSFEFLIERRTIIGNGGNKVLGEYGMIVLVDGMKHALAVRLH